MMSSLADRFGATVDFDIQDALKTLTRFDLWLDRDRFEVIGPAPCAAKLQEHRRRQSSVAYHEQCVRG